MRSKFSITRILLLFSIVLNAQPGNHLNDVEKAVSVFNKVYKSESASEFSKIEKLYFSLEGTNVNPRQGYDLLNAPEEWPSERVLNYWFFDFKERHFRNYSRGIYNGGHDLSFEELNVKDTSYYITTQMRKYLKSPNSFSNCFDSLKNIPGLLLAYARTNLSSISWIGEGRIDNQEVEIVEMDWSGKRTRLYVNTSTYKLAQISWLTKDFVTGTRSNVLQYDRRFKRDGLELPGQVRFYIDGRIRQDLAVKIFNSDPVFPDVLYELDRDHTPFNQKPWSVIQVTDHLYEIQGLSGGLYTIPFVILEDAIVVYDAIRNPNLFGKALDKIEGNFEKPVKHVILSHNHQDHIGGIAAAKNRDIEIITTVKTVPRLEELMSAPNYVYDEGVNRNEPSEYSVRIVTDTYTISSNTVSINIHNVGTTPHVDDLLYAVIKPDKVVIQADSYFEFSQWNAIFDFFTDWVKKMKLEDSIVTGTHMSPIPFRELVEEKKPEQMINRIPSYLSMLNLPGLHK